MKKYFSIFVCIFLFIFCAWQLWVLLNNLAQENEIKKVEIKPIEKSNILYAKIFTQNVRRDVTPKPLKSKSKSSKKTISIKKTSFPQITLVGIVFNSNSSLSETIISINSKQMLLGVGDSVADTQITIENIQKNNITMVLSGEKKTLAIGKKNQEKNNASRQVKGLDLKSKNPIERFQYALSQNPQNLIQFVRFSPIFEKNKITAYRISVGNDSEIFKALGLKKNDRVSRVSGAGFDIPLSSPDALLSLWSYLSISDEFVLHIDREGKKQEILIQLTESLKHQSE